MKKQKNNGSAKRFIIILSLSLALLMIIGVVSFAWIRNYVDVDTLEIKSGKMLYNVKLYRASNPENPIVFFDTKDKNDSKDAESDKRLEREINNAIIDIDDGEEVFFVVQKYPESIDFDFAISFEKDGINDKSFDYIGHMNFAMYDDSAKFNESGLTNYFKNLNSNKNDVAGVNLGNIWNTIQESSVHGTQEYACIRLQLNRKPEATSAEFEDSSFPFRIGFCIAQKGALPSNDGVDRYYVDDPKALEDAMQKYGFNDEIYITQNVDYTGDLVFTRPCTITLIRSKLRVKGNIIFSYMYGGKFTVNTVSDGHIIVENNAGAGGNFRIDLPDTTIELVGSNNDPVETNNWKNVNSDIYIEGSFTANASKKADEGIFLKGARVSNIKIVDGKSIYSADLKPILINGSSRVTVSNRTKIGELSANSFCKHFILTNNGYISKINLVGMVQDMTMLSEPSIFIDNAGTVADSRIVLPNWSKRFKTTYEANNSADDNTHIIANKGSGELRAITAENLENLNNGETTLDDIAAGDSFFSTGKKGDDLLRDDIDYLLRTQFVETVNGDKTKIVIHYETPSPIILSQGQYADLDSLNSLSSYVSYYADKGEIARASELVEVRIVCYGEKTLSAAEDYAFLKEMTSLITLDLSDAVSEGKRVPNEAFKNMSTLENVKMSESDTVWGPNIFTGTSVEEIVFPQSLTTLDNPRDVFGYITSQTVLDGLKYVRTSITVVTGFWLNPSVKQYLFTPDEFTYNKYRNLYDNYYWKSKIFIDNGATQYGDFFLRYDPDTTDVSPTCEFVVYTGEVEYDASGKKIGKEWYEEEKTNCGFDFQFINIDGKKYTITRYDAYALFDKFVYETNPIDIVLSSDVTYIGERAFACGPNEISKNGIRSIVINGNPEIIGSAFTYNRSLVSFSAPELTSLNGGGNLSNNDVLETVYMPKLVEVTGPGDLAKCPALEQVDISVIQRNSTNSNFYTSNDDYTYARFFIHTENAKSRSEYSAALAADYRHIFVHEDYAHLYKTNATPNYTGLTEMGKNGLDALIAADANGNDLVEGEQHAYYYVIDGDKARLVACMLSEIVGVGQNHTTIKSFNHNGKYYPVSFIGSAAYHFTAMTVQNIKVSDGVDKIGAYAFDSSKARFEKNCITFDLNNVVTAGNKAFYCMNMAKIVAEKLTSVGLDALTNNKQLLVAKLPLLSSSRTGGTIHTVFKGCSNLRIAYTSVSENILYDGDESRTKGYIRFINITNTSKISIPNINTISNNSSVGYQEGSFNYFATGDFAGIYLTDYYDYYISFGGLTDIISLPGYIFYGEGGDEVTLFAVSPDVASFGDFVGSNYTTPNNLYLDGENVLNPDGKKWTVKDNGTSSIYDVTKIGKYAYAAASFSALDKFIIGSNVKEIQNYGLYGTAYLSSSMNETMLKNIRCLDLANVEVIGLGACRKALVDELIANNLKVIGSDAFFECTNLTSVYLPAFEESVGAASFNGCTSLTSATFGANSKKFYSAMFQGARALTNITILNSSSVVTITPSNVDNSTDLIEGYESQVTISVPASVYKEYISQYGGGFGGIKNFDRFGQATTDTAAGYTCYWNVIDETAKTAYINYIEGSLPAGSFTIPSTLDGYTVVSVTSEAMAALSDVTKVILPANMEYLSFTAADLTDKVTALEISASNSKFSTVDGVLYSKDGTTLLVYPKAKATINVTLADTVTEIGYRAFYGSKKLKTLTINGVVTVRDQAFESSSISTIKFTNAAPSIFAGRDILLDANTNIVINIPTASLDAYKSKVLIDYSIIEKFVGA